VSVPQEVGVPRMGNCTAANKKLQLEELPVKEKVISFSPPAVDLLAGTDERGGLGGSSDYQLGKLLLLAPVSLKHCYFNFDSGQGLT
jgi:hypothetical protein